MGNLTLILLFSDMSISNLDSMLAEVVDETTTQVYIRAAPRWRMMGPIIRSKLRNSAKQACFDISYHSDYQLGLVEWYVRNIVPREKTEVVEDLS